MMYSPKKFIFHLPYQSEDSVPLYCLYLVAPAGGFLVKALTIPSSWDSSSLTAGPQGLWGPLLSAPRGASRAVCHSFGRETRAQGLWVTLLYTTLQRFFREQAHKLLPPREQRDKLQVFTSGASRQKELGVLALLEAASVLMSLSQRCLQGLQPG